MRQAEKRRNRKPLIYMPDEARRKWREGYAKYVLIVAWYRGKAFPAEEALSLSEMSLGRRRREREWGKSKEAPDGWRNKMKKRGKGMCMIFPMWAGNDRRNSFLPFPERQGKRHCEEERGWFPCGEENGRKWLPHPHGRGRGEAVCEARGGWPSVEGGRLRRRWWQICLSSLLLHDILPVRQSPPSDREILDWWNEQAGKIALPKQWQTNGVWWEAGSILLLPNPSEQRRKETILWGRKEYVAWEGSISPK